MRTDRRVFHLLACSGSPAAKDAAYVHAITHRMEGLCDGEFGDGYSNANYWYSAAGPHEIQVGGMAGQEHTRAPRLLCCVWVHHAAPQTTGKGPTLHHGPHGQPEQCACICRDLDHGRRQRPSGPLALAGLVHLMYTTQRYGDLRAACQCASKFACLHGLLACA